MEEQNQKQYGYSSYDPSYETTIESIKRLDKHSTSKKRAIERALEHYLNYLKQKEVKEIEQK